MIEIFKDYNQFINWEPRPKPNGKTDKVPVGPGGANIDPTDPRNWKSHTEAAGSGAPVGFVFTREDPFFFVDVDEAYAEGAWSSLAVQIVAQFPGCYVEVSQSGRGLHIFGRGVVPEGARCENSVAKLGFYAHGRFAALTFLNARGSSDTDGQAGVDWLVANYFQPRPELTPAEWTTEPCAGWAGPEDDDELIKRAKRSKSAAAAFGAKASFKDLFTGDTEKLRGFFPGDNETGINQSEADAALCAHLAFYTGRDCERMERIFNISALGQRDKWAERDDYRQRTILGAVAVCKSVYNRPPPPDPVGAAPAGVARTGDQFMDLESQLKHFKGCAYVISRHRISTPNAGLLKPDQFRAAFGGYKFATDFEGKPTKSAYEAFTESRIYDFPKVYGVQFRPASEPGAVITEEGLSYVNTYTSVNIERTPGDAGRFLGLLNKMLPHESDRAILLSYMAACVQHPGVKFQWAPMVQGVEGNGKTLIGTALSKAVGERYTHVPNASDLAGNGSKFTGWLEGKMLIVIEDVHENAGSDMQEKLKPLITNRRIEIQGKGADQFTGDNCANSIFFSNHKTAVLKSRNDRRYCVFFCAQQAKTDLAAAGMGGAYFPELYDWARGGGFSIITDYLLSYPIPDKLNPSGLCHRAPDTTSTREALGVSIGGVEQEIKEAIAEGRPGFRGGWVSSVALDRLLVEKRRRVALNKRRELLEGLGYLTKERLNSPSALDDNKKPMLYAVASLLAIPAGKETAAAYLNSQK